MDTALEGTRADERGLHCGASWNRTSGLILIRKAAQVVTTTWPYLVCCVNTGIAEGRRDAVGPPMQATMVDKRMGQVVRLRNERVASHDPNGRFGAARTPALA